MKYYILILCLLTYLISSCSGNHQNVPVKTTGDSISTKSLTSGSPQPHTHVKVNKDTLQFIHFDGNLDYWYAFFLTKNKDTLRLVTDKEFKSNQLNKLMEVTWKLDTLSEAGDNERKYVDKRLSDFREIRGTPFSPPITEKQVLEDIKNLVEVKEGADRVWITGKPDIEKQYYQVETATTAEDNISRFVSFRMYVFPKHEIKVLDLPNDKELTFAEWRKMNN